MDTAKAFEEDAHTLHHLSALNVQDTGSLAKLSTPELLSRVEAELALWRQNPFTYRFPGGQSQQDVVQGLNPLVLELERSTAPCLVISHEPTLHHLYGYFLGTDPRSLLGVSSLPHHTLVELLPTFFGWQENRYTFHVELGSTPALGPDDVRIGNVRITKTSSSHKLEHESYANPPIETGAAVVGNEHTTAKL